MRHSLPFMAPVAIMSFFVCIRAGGQALDYYDTPEMPVPPVDTWEPGPIYPEEMGPWDSGGDAPGFFGEYSPPNYPGPPDYWPEDYGYPPYYEPGAEDYFPEDYGNPPYYEPVPQDYGYPPYYEPGPQGYSPEEYNYPPPYEPVPQEYYPPPNELPQTSEPEKGPGYYTPGANVSPGGKTENPYEPGIAPDETQNSEARNESAAGARQERIPQGETLTPPPPGRHSGYRTPASTPGRRTEWGPYDQFARPDTTQDTPISESPAPPRSPRIATSAASPLGSSEASSPQSLPPAVSPSPDSNLPEPLVLRRVWEQSERAFSLLVPKGWETQGGLRRYSSAQSGVLQSAEPKVDYQVAGGPNSAVSVRWLPRSYYFDYSRSSAGRLGVRLPGNTFDNLPPATVKSAFEFLAETIFPGAHPEASDVQIVDRQDLPEFARQHEQWIHPLLPESDSDAVSLTVTYEEGGVRYKERLVGLIQFLGPDSGCWINTETRLFRAPADQFESWESVLAVILRSFTWDAEWLRAERDRLARENQRAGAVRPGLRLFMEASWQRAQAGEEALCAAWINGGRDQQTYLNPFTNVAESGSARWSRRWVGAQGDVIYSNRADFDPNQDPALGRQEFKVAAAAG